VTSHTNIALGQIIGAHVARPTNEVTRITAGGYNGFYPEPQLSIFNFTKKKSYQLSVQRISSSSLVQALYLVCKALSLAWKPLKFPGLKPKAADSLLGICCRWHSLVLMLRLGCGEATLVQNSRQRIFWQLNTTFFSFIPRSVSKLATPTQALITLGSPSPHLRFRNEILQGYQNTRM
jgi:hypothetical protein